MDQPPVQPQAGPVPEPRPEPIAYAATPSASASSPAPSPPARGTVHEKKRSRGCLIALGVVLLAFLVIGVFLVPITVAVLSSGEGVTGRVGGDIALIRISGVIASSDGGGLLAGATTSPERILKLIKRADASSQVKVILLRVDSPGGVASAGEEIAEAVKKAKKPVVVSIADVGASAAYMIASQADHIVATPASLVGSIGVILEVPNYEGLYSKLGIKTITLHEGKFKDIGSPTRPMTAEERRFLQVEIKEIYEQFVALVAEGRNMPVAKVRSLATGLFWNGSKAKKLGLIDEVGNYDDAVRAAARIGGIKGEPSVVELGQPNFWDALSGSLTQGVKSAVGEALRPAEGGPRTR